jgi:undecaprenol kinase/diacylglycerol kinase (ATP)
MIRLLRSFKWAGQGLWYCICREKNFQVHCGLAVLAFCLGAALKISSLEWILIVISISSVLAFEMLNSAIEHLCNIVHPTPNPTVKVVKDISAGAVLVIAIMAVTCGAIIFIPKIISLF